MIRKLRRRFVAAAMISLTMVLLVILGTVNLVSFRKNLADADRILSVLSENHGTFPMHMFPAKGDRRGEPFRRPGFSPETPYESRFFSVILNDDSSVRMADLANIAAIDMDTAREYARQALFSGKPRGFVSQYRFAVQASEGETCVIFLDFGRNLSDQRTMLLASFGVAATALLAVFLLLLVISGRIVRPVAESYEKQRRFITDAGHELKTPLTVISADADLLELDLGENEWLEDIRRQTQRLTGLTNDLISLSRMDEEKPEDSFVDFPMSDVVEETADSFQSLAAAQNKKLNISIQPMLELNGSEKEIRRLTSILLDNALKYSPDGTVITLSLSKDARTQILRVENESLQPIKREKLSHLFERFYRLDDSHSSTTGGYGLGLAIARGIVAAHKGKIRADSPDEKKLAITAVFPSGK